jgi:hypothetical protein
MALLGYNRKLLWVVVPAILWACLGLSVMAGPPPDRGQPDSRPPIRFGLGPKGDAVFVQGAVRSIIEEQERLTVVVEQRGGGSAAGGSAVKPVTSTLPGLVLEVVAPGKIPAGPLELRLRSGMRQPRRLPGGASGVLTERFFIKLEQDGVRIVPRPPDLGPPRPGGERWDGPGGGGGQRRDEIRQRLRDWLRGGRQERRERRMERRDEPDDQRGPGTDPGAPPKPPDGQ